MPSKKKKKKSDAKKIRIWTYEGKILRALRIRAHIV